MTKIAGKLYSKFNFFSRKRQFELLPITNDDPEHIEDFHTIGSEIFKAIAAVPEATTTKSPSIRGTDIEDALTIHTTSRSGKSLTDVKKTRTEISKSQKQQGGEPKEDINEKANLSGIEWQNKVKRLKYFKRTIELARRKRFENQGSFAMNMVTYRDHKNTIGIGIDEKGNGERESRSHRQAIRSTRSFGQDDQSRSSESTCKTNDATLQVIDEEATYYNT